MARKYTWDQLHFATKLIGLSDWWKLDDTVIHQIVFDSTQDLDQADLWVNTAQYMRDNHNGEYT